MVTTWNEALVAHKYADVGGVRLHYVEAGSGPLVILLHGFPEFWYSWHYQIPALVAAGYRVVAPDMRGYNLSDKPRGVQAYAVEKLADDVAGLIRACGAEKAVVGGHDWGAGVAWTFAMQHPDMLERLMILNVPHPARMMAGLRTLRQLSRSWYMFFFQIPWVPETLTRLGNFASLRRTLRQDPRRRGAFTPDDIDRYIEALAQPGALTSAINYYRALIRRNPRTAQETIRPINKPVLIIWGERDRYLGKDLAIPPSDLVPEVQIEMIPNASHWVQVDRPERVNAIMLDFLKPVLTATS